MTWKPGCNNENKCNHYKKYGICCVPGVEKVESSKYTRCIDAIWIDWLRKDKKWNLKEE